MDNMETAAAQTAAAVDKWLHADGSVTTSAGNVILPADEDRAEEYKRRAAFTDKWLRPDGSVIDMTGKTIMDADESRAREYESRAASATSMFPQGGGSGFKIFEDTSAYVMPFAHGNEAVEPNIFALTMSESENSFFPLYAIMRPGVDVVDASYPITDTASAVLQ